MRYDQSGIRRRALAWLVRWLVSLWYSDSVTIVSSIPAISGCRLFDCVGELADLLWRWR